VCVLSNPEEVYAVMPYAFSSDRKRILMPPLTPFLGPWWKIYSDKYAKKLSHEVGYLTELLEQLPPFDRFEQRWHPTHTNWLPFYWRGFSQTTKYHYIIEPALSEEEVWENFKDKIRKQIRKAQKELAVLVSDDVHELFRQWQYTFHKQNMETPVNLSLLEKIFAEVQSRNCGKLFLAKDVAGHVHGALFIIRDRHTAYGLLSGADPARKSSAPALLLWHAIRYAVSEGLAFDFCGSMIKPVENFLRDFGGKQVPYFEISKTNSRWVLFRQGLGMIRQALMKKV
jgi:hypothetical protein